MRGSRCLLARHRRHRGAASAAGAAAAASMMSVASAGLLVALLAAPAGAMPRTANGAAPGLSVTPAKVVAQVPAGTYRYTLTLTNPGATSVPVRLESASMGQNPTGAATFDPGAAPVAMQFQPSQLVLAPNAEQQVEVSVPVAATSPGIWEAALAVFGAPGTQAGDVTTQTAVASLLELTGPAAGSQSAAIASLRATGTGGDQVAIDAEVRDTGDVLIAPTATAVVSAGSRVLATLPLGVPRIVPGALVRVQGAWTAPDLTGAITVTVRLSDPSAEAATTVQFDRGVAARTAVAIGDLRALSVQGGARVSMKVRDIGTTIVHPAFDVAQFSHRRWHEPGSAVPVGTIGPGATRAAATFVPLVPGRYELAVRLYAGSTLLAQGDAYVDVESPGTSGLVAVALGAALVVLAAMLLAALRRRAKAAPRATS